MRIGIVGLDWDRGIPLALAMRDYGGHSVIAYHPSTKEIINDWHPDTEPPEREVQTLLHEWNLPVTDRLDLFSDYVDQIYLCVPGDPATGWLLHRVAQYRGSRTPIPVVIVHPMDGEALVAIRQQEAATPQLSFVYMPWWVDRSNALATYTDPQGPVWLSGSSLPAFGQVEQVWRHLFNNLPLHNLLRPLGVGAGTINRMREPIGNRSRLAPVTTETPAAGVDTPAPEKTKGDRP